MPALYRDGEKVADAAVFLDTRVADAIEDGFFVRRELGVCETAQRQEYFGSHVAIGYLQLRGADITFLRFHFLLVTGGQGQQGGSQHKKFRVHRQNMLF